MRDLLVSHLCYSVSRDRTYSLNFRAHRRSCEAGVVRHPFKGFVEVVEVRLALQGEVVEEAEQSTGEYCCWAVRGGRKPA